MNTTTQDMMALIAKMPDGPRKQSMLAQMRTRPLPDRQVDVRPVEPPRRETGELHGGISSRQIAQQIQSIDPPSEMSIWIPGWHPTRLNKIMEGHWSNGGRIKKADSMIMLLAFNASRIPAATGPRRVSAHFILAKGVRGGDPDSRQKVLFDSLKKCGAIVDDTRRLCIIGTMSYSRTERDVWGTLIMLRDE